MGTGMDAPKTGYRLEKLGTGAGVGWFSCVPEGEVDLEAGFDHLARSPMDRFMHRHVVSLLTELEPEALARWVDRGEQGEPHVLVPVYEVCLTVERFQPLLERFDPERAAALERRSPEVVIPWAHTRASNAGLYWVRCFSHNVLLHEPLPGPEEAEHPVPVTEAELKAWADSVVPVRRMGFSAGSRGETATAPSAPSRREIRDLQARLEGLGVLEGWETRTEATLSPFAVERPWRLDVRTRHGRNAWRLSGTQTSYGRGFHIRQARMSCLMEIVERFSAFASFEPDRVAGTRAGLRLRSGTPQELKQEGLRVLDLDRVRLEVPYRGGPLCWVEGEEAAAGGPEPVMVPAQLAFLFANLDEAGLTSGLSSNGLGAGASVGQARLSGLLEVIERDAQRVVPFSRERCFVLEAEDPRVSEMLEGLRKKGVSICFVDLTPELGVPCYEAFVEGPGGIVLKGCGAHLDGRRAVVSAMTEIPWPYPYWFGTAPPPEGTPRVRFEDLPCWSTGTHSGDLERLETLLRANGYTPVYVDLTREDLGLPVCRALVPGLEMMTLFDRYTPLGVRSFGHYLARSGN